MFPATELGKKVLRQAFDAKVKCLNGNYNIKTSKETIEDENIESLYIKWIEYIKKINQNNK